MMKNSTSGILLFLMLLAVTPRNSSANVIPAAAVEIIEGASLINEAVKGLPPVDITGLTIAIREFERSISHFPIKLSSDVKQQVLGKLYRSQDKIVRIRGVLVGLAHQLKSECEGLLIIFDSNPGVYSIGILNYSVTKFVKLANHVHKNLNDAEKKLLDVLKELGETKTGLVTFESNIKDAQKAVKEKELSNYEDNKWDFWSALVPSVLSLGIAIPFIIDDNEASLAKVENRLALIESNLKKTTESLSGVIKHNENLRVYVQEELRLIHAWKLALESSITDHENGIEPEDIEFGIGRYKHNLKNLIKTCDDYIGNEFPGGRRRRRKRRANVGNSRELNWS